MNIVYINGFNGENSNKPQILSKMFDVEVYHLKLKFKDGKINTKDLDNYFENNYVDFIVGSSTGGYIGRYYAHKYNIPLVTLNPVVDYIKTFNKIGYKLILDDKFQNLNKLSVSSMTLINKDDELIDYKYTLKSLKGHFKIYPSGGHRFNNLNDTTNDIKDFLRYLFI